MKRRTDINEGRGVDEKEGKIKDQILNNKTLFRVRGRDAASE